MITKYECEHCNKQFDTMSQCKIHELSHLEGDAHIKYYIKNMTDNDICDHCDHAYYVYGCRRECIFFSCCASNNYKDFKLRRAEFNDDN